MTKGKGYFVSLETMITLKKGWRADLICTILVQLNVGPLQHYVSARTMSENGMGLIAALEV